MKGFWTRAYVRLLITNKMQYDFRPRRGTVDAICAWRADEAVQSKQNKPVFCFCGSTGLKLF